MTPEYYVENADAQKRLAQSLTADDITLLPHLPYLLQDLWELGTPYQLVAELARQIPPRSLFRALDLACGKGAIGIRLARDFGWNMTLVDAIPQFIHEAKTKASEYGVANLCDFRVEDASATIQRETGYDCVIMLATGDIIGPPAQTVRRLAGMVAPGGYIILDETFIADSSAQQAIHFAYPYPSESEWHAAYRDAGVRRVAAASETADDMPDQNAENNRVIRQRAGELSTKYPHLAEKMARYVENQEAECFDIENNLISTACLLQRHE